MQTLYIDVYFLINFTVDILAIYFAVSFSSVPTTRLRLVLGGVLGALFASAAIFIDSLPFKLVLSIIFSVIIATVSVGGASIMRRLKFFFAFLVFETLIGGFVYFLYSFLDRYIYSYISSSDGSPENRSILIISIVILLSVGVFKLFLTVFSSEGRRGSLRLEVEAFDKITVFDAFIDSGNLVRDPTDMRAVMLVKERLARRMFPCDVVEENSSALSYEAKKRIRLIPVSDDSCVKILIGIRPKRVSAILKNGKKEDIDLIIAIDKEGGAYGGYDALVPSSAVEDVL